MKIPVAVFFCKMVASHIGPKMLCQQIVEQLIVFQRLKSCPLLLMAVILTSVLDCSCASVRLHCDSLAPGHLKRATALGACNNGLIFPMGPE